MFSQVAETHAMHIDTRQKQTYFLSLKYYIISFRHNNAFETIHEIEVRVNDPYQRMAILFISFVY